MKKIVVFQVNIVFSESYINISWERFNKSLIVPSYVVKEFLQAFFMNDFSIISSHDSSVIIFRNNKTKTTTTIDKNKFRNISKESCEEIIEKLCPEQYR